MHHTIEPPRIKPEWDWRIHILQQTVKTLPQQQAAMFMLADEGYTSVFEQLIAALISVRTTENVTLAASRRLLDTARTPAKMAAFSEAQIVQLIKPCTFPEPKARDIRAIAIAARDLHHGTLPCDVDVLDAFHGVGPKVANLAIAGSRACDQPSGIPVDIHVHRVANRWGVIESTTPEKSQAQLGQSLPRKYWAEINRLLVPFGKFVCTGVSPKCSTCPLREMCAQVGVTTHR